MSQEKNQSKNEKLNKDTVNDNSVSLAVKKKRFKKIDILVLCICIVTSALIWIYASNLEKKKDAETIKKDDLVSKDDIEDLKNQAKTE